jgi:transcriptional regulator with XRE-family HTH domain
MRGIRLNQERQEPMSERFSLGARIRELRKLHSISMQTLANESGISQGHLSDIESGKAANPSIATTQAIATAFGLTVSELLLENKIQRDDDDRLALLTNLYVNDLDDFGREAVLVIAKLHRQRTL